MHGLFWLKSTSWRIQYYQVTQATENSDFDNMLTSMGTRGDVMLLKKVYSSGIVLPVLLGLLLSPMALAQHSHGILTPGVTFPQDDSVLIDPPQMITMSFRVDVSLLKLALYTAEEKWINIGFQFIPDNFTHSYVYPIPGELPASEYYIAKWSVTDENRRLLNGEFKFAFGPGAISPSETIDSRVSDLVENLPTTGSYRQTPSN